MDSQDKNWGFMWPPDTEHWYYEDGTKELLRPQHYLIDFGKYKGLTLDQVNDEWYLSFLQGVADKNEDWFLNKCLSLNKKSIWMKKN